MSDVYERCFKDIAYQDDTGIWRWKSNNRVPFNDMLEANGITGEELERHEAAREIDDDAFLAAYRKRMENYEPSAEERFEMEAAFGKGTTVVNVITGKEIKL